MTMGFYVQDDMWEAVSELPRKQQDEVLGAMCRLFFTGGQTPLRGASKALFTAFRERVSISSKRSECGKRNGRRSRSETEGEPPSETEGKGRSETEGEPPSETEGKGRSETEGEPPSKTEGKGRSKTEGKGASETGAKTEPSIKEGEGDIEKKKKPPMGGYKEKENPPRFKPPTAAEVAAYAGQAGLSLDAARFCDFYASKGWRVGSSPMRDWRAACRNWARRKDGPGRFAAAEGVGADEELEFYASLV